MIGERTAEQIKMEIGSAYKVDENEEEQTMDIKGRDLISGLPKVVVVDAKPNKKRFKRASFINNRINQNYFRKNTTRISG